MGHYSAGNATKNLTQPNESGCSFSFGRRASYNLIKPCSNQAWGDGSSDVSDVTAPLHEFDGDLCEKHVGR